ncbi:MAG: helix-turn-helix domain-containing protein [Spirochaetaceae bacterium]|nr:helix-turn-helix domain-containing protein [Spirochaetaceae bacterium]
MSTLQDNDRAGRRSGDRRLSPVVQALEIVGDRWTVLILLELLRGFLRFAELRRRVFGIAPNILSHRLKRLVRYGIVERRFYSEHPPRAEYALTRRGHELGVVAGALAVWGRKHLSDGGALVHAACGTPIRVGYSCSACDRAVPGADVRLVEDKSHQDRAEL